ncbi:MAG: DEAD/DEAH box helicase [Firmicutes bacterium]|nr:DEAD/DEAH box helicase [Bacillota bacterium]
MFNITNELIKDLATNHITYKRGQRYYNDKKVKMLKLNKSKYTFKAIVSGNRDYKVKIHFDNKGNFKKADCTCPAYDEYWGYCKHIVSTFMEIKKRDFQGEYNYIKSNNITKSIIDFFKYKKDINKKAINLELNYEFNSNVYDEFGDYSYLNLRIGEEKLYVVKNIKKLIESIKNNESLYYGKKFTFNPEFHKFKDKDKPIINYLKELLESEYIINESLFGYGRNSLFKGKYLTLTESSVKRFFNLTKKREFNAFILGKEYKNLKIIYEDIPLDLNLSKKENKIILKMNNEDAFIPLVSDGEYYFTNGFVYKVSQKQKEYLMPFSKALVNTDKIEIPHKYSEEFLYEVYPFIKELTDVKIEKNLKNAIYDPKINPELYLDKEGKKIIVDVKFIYDDIIINPFLFNEKVNRKEGKILLRDMETEKKIISIIENSEFKIKNNQVYLEDDEKIYNFINTEIPKLKDISEIYYSEKFKNMKIYDASSFTGGIKLNTDKDMLEFSFGIENISNKELVEVFNSLKEKRKYYRLKDGSYIPLNNEGLKNASDLMNYLDLDENDLKEDIIEIPKFKALYLDERLEESNYIKIDKSSHFKKLVDNIKKPQDIEIKIPNSLKNILRDYQKFGFKWLKILSHYGLGGILADDMGLGKTLQVLAFLLSEKKEKGFKPSLIIAPTSLVYNWASEVDKFTKDLNILVVSGDQDERSKMIENINKYDIIVTSYPLIRRDIKLYDFKFRYCILDEAQHIKNKSSKNAKSVKQINANNYFALTGTPIENSLTELWSIFDFIMPGYLYSYTKFRKRFEKPIIKDNNKKALKELNRFIKPFILRRLKKNVLKELPEKIEHKVVADLTTEQKKIYLAYLNKIKGEIEEEIENKGFNRSHIKILSGLIRLRQICCHPSMFINDYKGKSGKLELLEEIITESIDSGHRILLFSQFTTMLNLIKDMLNKRNIEYLYLDGSTKSENRGELVNEFNKGKGEIFLISLKAGGTGLNLTGADTVIHFDPWWNPAVEEQATDRAYRIGQQNSVHVMKFITKGTIEEKILKLQNKKKEMIDSVIHPGETLVSKMSEEEIRELFE